MADQVRLEVEHQGLVGLFLLLQLQGLALGLELGRDVVGGEGVGTR